MDTKKRSKIALFGLSGNPPTGNYGHRGVIRHIQSLSIYSDIIVLPVYNHMYETKNTTMMSYDHRYRMCKSAFESLNDDICNVSTKITVSDFERSIFQYHQERDSNIQRIGTIDIIEYLEFHDFPSDQYELTFILGADTFIDLMKGKWKRSNELVEKLHFEVFLRHGYQLDLGDDSLTLLPQARFDIRQISTLSDVSSTSVRLSILDEECRRLCEGNHYELFPEYPLSFLCLYPSVRAYITQHGLYGYPQYTQQESPPSPS